MKNILIILAMMLFVISAQAYQDDYIEVTFISEHSALKPGASSWVGVQFSPVEHWHIYWQNPGDSGLAPKITLTLPDGIVAGDIHWPVPESISMAHMVNYGYHKVLLMIPLTVSESVPVGQDLSIQAKVSWLVCDEECVPGRARFQLSLPVSKQSLVPSQYVTQFQHARHLLPKSLTTVANYRVVNRQIELKVKVPANAEGDIKIFPLTPDMVTYSEFPEISRKGSQITAIFPLSEYATDIEQPFEFVMQIGNKAIYQGSATAAH